MPYAATPDPYRPFFETLEVADRPTTGAAYEGYRNYVDQQGYDPCIYVSMAITSGGYVRDQNLGFGEALDRNAAHGAMVADVLVAQYDDLGIQRSDIVVPASLGKVAGWGQADYLVFWGHVITGIDPELADHADRTIRSTGITEAPGFTDKSLPKEVRWQDYKQLIDQYVQQVDQYPHVNDPQNIQAIVLGLDPQESLGVNAERYLGHQIGIGEYRFGIDDPTPEIEQEIQSAQTIGCTTLAIGSPDIYGEHALSSSLRQRMGGKRWRKSGIICGVVDRREAAVIASMTSTLGLPAQSQADVWAEYYQ